MHGHGGRPSARATCGILADLLRELVVNCPVAQRPQSGEPIVLLPAR